MNCSVPPTHRNGSALKTRNGLTAEDKDNILLLSFLSIFFLFIKSVCLEITLLECLIFKAVTF